MTEHACTTLASLGECYRCDLNRDELESYSEDMDVVFDEWVKANPWVVSYLEEVIYEAIEELGFQKMGFRMFWERLRWDSMRPAFKVARGLGDEFGLNDKLHGRMVRLILARNPHWDGLFETRRLRT